MSIDFTKPVQTRDGRKARVICTDVNSKLQAVVAVIEVNANYPGEEIVVSYTSDGNFGMFETPLDLVNVPERHSVWMNEYKKEKCHPFGGLSSTRSLCDDVCLTATERTAVIEIVYEDSKFVKAIRHAV